MKLDSLVLAGISISLSWSLGCAGDELADELPPELPALADAPCPLVSQAYRIDSLRLPATIPAALDSSLDLDGDPSHRPDNLAGTLYASIGGQYEGRLDQLSASIDAALTDGRVRWLIVVDTCADGSNYARVGLQRASDLDGDGALRVLPFGYLPAVGTRDGDHIVAREGTASAPVSTLFDVLGTQAEVVWVDGTALAVDVDEPASGGSISGRFGFGLEPRAFDVAAGPLAAFYSELLALGASDLATEIDADGDGVITADEVAADEIMRSLSAPDLDLTADFAGVDVYWPRHDGVAESSSIGLGFTAVPVDLD